MSLQARLEQSAPIPLAADIHCERGELLALVGPSGSGKSTILRCLAGLYRPSGGYVQCGADRWFDAEHGVDVPVQQRRVGLVFQNYALLPHLTALGNVMLALGHLPRTARPAKAREWLARVHLEGLEMRRPHALSGGQQQRVALARALAREPQALLLDEPFAAVDRVTRRALLGQLMALRCSLAIPIVLVTHDLEEASLLADRMTVLHGGRTLQTASPQQVLAQPASIEVARLTGQANLLTGVIHRHLPEINATEIDWLGQPLLTPYAPSFAVGERVHWVIPAEGVVLLSGAVRDLPNVVSARVVECVRWRGHATLSANVGDCASRAISVATGAALAAEQEVGVGSKVFLQLQKSAIHLLVSASQPSQPQGEDVAVSAHRRRTP
jgi:molybdate transport system ATP-binding protein